MYLANAILTYLLVLLMFASRSLFRNSLFHHVAVLLESLGGFFNAATYGWQSRYVCAPFADCSDVLSATPVNGGTAPRPSYRVTIDEISLCQSAASVMSASSKADDETPNTASSSFASNATPSFRPSHGDCVTTSIGGLMALGSSFFSTVRSIEPPRVASAWNFIDSLTI
eukprot:CAMPEP_0194535670 /NCGR_PEP_ID=MMETSP0253-20130528/74264_1 /TAXON_ID=2966 /ORGANISM="Noctiluca scintillans" /LENGTH=169 /DNA_ID=CAMNT_0039381479 /DNA_START=575 /DNA_END=1084 /DNA_ORIENTATION=+